MWNPFARWLERRAVTFDPPDGSWWTAGSLTDSGAVVSPLSALNVPSVFSCVQILSQDIGRTPIRFRQKTAPDTYEDVTDHPLAEILGSLANPEMTSYQLQFALMWELLLYGRCYAQVVRVDGRIDSLWPLESARMSVTRDPATRQKQWHYSGGVNNFSTAEGAVVLGGPTSAAKMFTFPFNPSAPPILEVTMQSPIQRCKDVIGLALSLQTYLSKFFGNGAQPRGVLQAKGPLTDVQAQSLLTMWNAGHRGAALAHSIGIIDSGVEFKPIAMENDSAQMVELWRAITEQVCGSFRVPVSKVGDLSKANYANMQISEQVYVTSTLDPYYRAFELAFRRDLLTSRQFNLYTVEFDRAALTRNDTKALHDALCQGIQNGIYSINDARRKLGENPIGPDGDEHLINTALAPVIAPPKEAPVVA